MIEDGMVRLSGRQPSLAWAHLVDEVIKAIEEHYGLIEGIAAASQWGSFPGVTLLFVFSGADVVALSDTLSRLVSNREEISLLVGTLCEVRRDDGD